jgi:uncharacterized protein
MSSLNKKEPSGGTKFLVVMLYIIGVVLQAVIVYYILTGADLISAASSNDLEAVKSSIAQGANVNDKDKDGKTALIYASEKGNADIVKFLIAQGANVNAKDKDGKTALMYAADKGHTDVVALLKNAGATQ